MTKALSMSKQIIPVFELRMQQHTPLTRKILEIISKLAYFNPEAQVDGQEVQKIVTPKIKTEHNIGIYDDSHNIGADSHNKTSES